MLPLSPLLRPKKFSGLSKLETDAKNKITSSSDIPSISEGAANNSRTAGPSESGYGGAITAKPGTFFTMEFRDRDGDGVDDRYQLGPGQSRGSIGSQYVNPNLDQGTQSPELTEEEEDGNINTNSLLQKSFRKIVG